MPFDFDVVVVGAGAMGTATARSLARRGRSTLALEQFPLGHARGSSGGPTRIFRLSYEHPDYVRMARRALGLWRELEEAAGERLLITTGGIDLGQRSRASAEALERAGEPFRFLPSKEASQRWPALRFDPGEEILFQKEAGVLMAERTVRAQARLAAEAGATVLERTKVEGLAVRNGLVEIHAGGRSYRAPVGVVTAGAWAGPLLAGVGIDVPLVSTLEQVSYFALEDASPLPTVIDWVSERSMIPYAVPNPERPGSVKVALYRIGPEISPNDAEREPKPEGVAAVRAWADRRFATKASAAEPTETCLYTNTPDEEFILDRIGPIVIGSPCSGHGFKFTPLIGEILADLATGRPPPVPLSAFSSGRSFERRRLDYHARSPRGSD